MTNPRTAARYNWLRDHFHWWRSTLHHPWGIILPTELLWHQEYTRLFDGPPVLTTIERNELRRYGP
jgi:hypothetical protein